MSEIRPFRAWRYDPARVDLGRVIAPPYDVVNPDARRRYWDRDPHNALRLELTRETEAEAVTDYREAAEALAGWRAAGVLRRDPEPALYGLRQRFRGPDGSERVRDGFFALLRLEDYERRVVLPHERTLRGPKQDRLKLLRATRANLSSVFLLYEDRDGELDALVAERAAEGARVRDDAGVEHTLVPISDAGAVTAARAFLAKRPVVIADGHHRYETALAFREEERAAGRGEGGADWVLGYFSNAFAPGSLLLPIHRVIRRGRPVRETAWASLPGWRQERIPLEDLEKLPELLERHLAPKAQQCAFAADLGDGVLRVFVRDRGDDLPIRCIHREVIEGLYGLDAEAVRDGALAYFKDPGEAAREVRAGAARAALYLNSLAPDDVFRVTARGELLPQKSTFFSPKLPSGLVFRLLEDG